MFYYYMGNTKDYTRSVFTLLVLVVVAPIGVRVIIVCPVCSVTLVNEFRGGNVAVVGRNLAVYSQLGGFTYNRRRDSTRRGWTIILILSPWSALLLSTYYGRGPLLANLK